MQLQGAVIQRPHPVGPGVPPTARCKALYFRYLEWSARQPLAIQAAAASVIFAALMAFTLGFRLGVQGAIIAFALMAPCMWGFIMVREAIRGFTRKDPDD